ncbi:MAG: transporter [Pseudomonadota bacterium]
MRKYLRGVILGLAALAGAPGYAQVASEADAHVEPLAQSPEQPPATTSELVKLRREVAAERVSLLNQIEAMKAQQTRLADLERRLSIALGEPQPQSQPPIERLQKRQIRLAQADQRPAAPKARVQTSTAAAASTQVASNRTASPQSAVGVAPVDDGQQPEIASLGRQGSAITQKGRLSGEVEWSYARADRNRALFRGVEVVESVLVGVFDINESRQDVFTNSIGLQYGLTSDIEVGVDVPFIARWDTSILTPVAATGDGSREIDNSANGYGIGDITLSARKQLLAPAGFGPYVIGNVQATIPTGTGPFEVARNEFGEASQAATGSGFWGVTGGLTAILPSDPGVLFGSLSYTKNFADTVNADIPPVRVARVNPGDSLSFSGGVGLALNPRLSLNFGYAHTWGFGTETTTVSAEDESIINTQTSRDLQVGRLLFGTTYKIDQKTSVNFGLEAGLTDDATDLRVSFRFPFVF